MRVNPGDSESNTKYTSTCSKTRYENTQTKHALKNTYAKYEFRARFFGNYVRKKIGNENVKSTKDKSICSIHRRYFLMLVHSNGSYENISNDEKSDVYVLTVQI